MGAPIHTQNDGPCSRKCGLRFWGREEARKGVWSPGVRTQLGGGKAGWGETEEEGSGDGSQTPERQLGFVTHTDDGLPTAQGWARGRAKTE